MVPYVIIPQNTQISLPIPQEYVGKRVTVSVSLDTSEKTEKKLKLSEILSGSLSKERVNELQKEATQMRNEWDRNTY